MSNIRRSWCLVGYFVCSIIAWAIKVYGFDMHAAGLYISHEAFVSYTSPLIVVASIMLVSFFSRLKIGKRPATIIACFAPCAFAVYLLNCNRLIWGDFLPMTLGGLKGSGLGIAGILACTLLYSLAFFIGAILIEKGRLLGIALIKRVVKR